MFRSLGDRFRLTAAVRQVMVMAAGLAIEASREALVPGLAPLIALSLMAAPDARLGIPKAVAIIVLVSGIALAVLGLTTAALSTVGLYAIVVAVLYVWAFYLCFGPTGGALGRIFLMMTVSVSALTAGSELVAAVIVQDMVSSIAVGVGLALLVLAIGPMRATRDTTSAVMPKPDVGRAARASVATAIMMPLHLYMTFDGFAAIVLLLTAATMLTEPGWGRFKAYGLVFAGGNLIGGTLALIAASAVTWQPAFPVFLSVTVAGSASIAYWVHRPGGLAPFFGPAGAAFVLLFGMTLSPLATGADVDVMGRVYQILLAILYVLGATSIALAALEFSRHRRGETGDLSIGRS